MKKIIILILAVFIPTQLVYAIHQPWTKTEFPQDKEKLWWNDDWWENGKIEQPSNYDVVMTETTYKSGDMDIPAYIFRPKKPGKYLPVLFQHGRRGLDDLTLLVPRRLAARGFVVLAPDIWNGRFINPE
ncbi:MAG: hypothetical protein BMS9Abin33_0374 [Gammaproteobacteria bacterium]|nr:MAG: hypothetical protein BMS9Abin33_0374 [Gammaproteobacteria bacterium]